jgi:hypothetical protein
MTHCQVKYTGCGTVRHIVRISSDNVAYGTMTSAFHLAMCHVIPRPVQPSNVSYGTTTGLFHLAMWRIVILHWLWYRMAHCHVALVVVPHSTLPAEIHWLWYRIIHCSVKYQPVQHDNATYGNTTSVFHMAICHAVPRPVSFTWQCAIRYHDQRLSHGTKVESSTPSSDEV